MTDKLGRIWLIGLFTALAALTIYLWMKGESVKEPSQETYLYAEASKLLGCRPYLISRGMTLDENKNGVKEYLFSCDSALSSAHEQFIWMEIHKKKVHVLLWHSKEGFKVGESLIPSHGYSWLLDRGENRLLAIPAREDTFAEPLEIIWNPQSNTLSFGVSSD
ncbi:MAG: hypothetical protein NZZ60_08360 [Bacteroidia bacterium]|nr:hypothetical protein [Bacteroidia bacterium]MCX7651956.1 hypothetical protein [Bacteroidia bacterium]MDW8416107.1 hypothetical protein [Bacteroidia bacterium]